MRRPGWRLPSNCIMKPLPIIISILVLIFSIARMADSCSKREKRQKGKEFHEWLTKIDRQKDSVMAYQYFATDSISWMVDHRKSFDRTLDSSIQYYKDNYTQDEERYKIYLKILYEYKKLSYLYYDWIKTSRFNEDPSKKEKDYRPLSFSDFKSREREITFGMSRFNIDVMMLD